MQLQTFMGSLQWFDLLNRPTLAALDEIYNFNRLASPSISRALPSAVAAELAISLLLLPLVQVNMRRPWCQILGATDASTEYGFGACTAQVTEAQARQLGRWASKGDCFVRLLPDDSSTCIKEPRGILRCVHLRKRDFTTSLSAPFQFKSHINSLEADALLLYVKWLTRTPRHFARRAVVLVDSQSVIGAVAKGQSSAPGLKRQLRRLASYLLATDIATAHLCPEREQSNRRSVPPPASSCSQAPHQAETIPTTWESPISIK